MPATRQRKQKTPGKRSQERHGRYKQGSRHRSKREQATAKAEKS